MSDYDVEMPLTPQLIESAVDRYFREFDRYAKLSEFVGEACRKILDINVIRGSVQWRAKSSERLRGKLEKWLTNREHESEITDLDSVFSVIKDLAGVRITTYVESDRSQVVERLVNRFSGMGGRTVDPVKKDEDGKFYRATHCSVALKDEELIGIYQNLKGLGCEVQVCSLLAHVYNEVEHDLRYKPLAGTLSDSEIKLLDSLGHLVATGDIVVNQILLAVEGRQKQSSDIFEDEYDFVVRMRVLFPEAHRFATNAGQLYEACQKLGLNSPLLIQNAIMWREGSSGLEGYQRAEDVGTYITVCIQTQLEVDPESSDLLAVMILANPDCLARLKELYPSGRGLGRATRLMSLGKYVQEAPRISRIETSHFESNAPVDQIDAS